jgi:outer membrane lipoprotein-sorting protein
MPWLKTQKWAWLLLASVLWPAASPAAEFAGKTVTRERNVTIPGKIYVKDGKLRQEFIDEKGQTITILRQDKKVVWVVLPVNRTYMEVPLKPKWPGQFIQIPPDAKTKRLVGNERVLGFDAQKFEVNVSGREGLEKQTFWVATKLGLPIKVEIPSRNFSMEYRDITERNLPDRLFEIPHGYQKVTVPPLEP